MDYPILAVTAVYERVSPVEQDEQPTASVGSFLPGAAQNYSTFGDRLEPLHYTLYSAIGSYLVVIGFVGIVGNCVVVFVLSSGNHLRKAFNVLLMNLALSDLSINLFSLPLTASSSFAGQWLFGDLGCRIYGTLMFLFSISSINTLAMISFIRLVAISQPQWGSKVENKRFIVIAIVCSWFYSIFWASAPLLGWSAYVLEPYSTACSIDWHLRSVSSVSYNVSIFVTCFGIQLLFIVRCYWLIWRRGLRALNRRRSNWKCSRTGRRIGSTQKRLLKMCTIVVVLYFVAWVPYAVYSMWTVYLGRNPNVAASVIPSLLAKSSTVYNPIVYVLMHKKIKRNTTMLARGICCGYSDVPAKRVRHESSRSRGSARSTSDV